MHFRLVYASLAASLTSLATPHPLVDHRPAVRTADLQDLWCRQRIIALFCPGDGAGHTAAKRTEDAVGGDPIWYGQYGDYVGYPQGPAPAPPLPLTTSTTSTSAPQTFTVPTVYVSVTTTVSITATCPVPTAIMGSGLTGLDLVTLFVTTTKVPARD